MTRKTVNELGNTCLNDFSVYGVSGALRTLSVNNPNNVAGSDAAVVASVTGAGSGDAFFAAGQAAGGGAWTWGLDNSASDKFVISSGAALGTNDVMEVYAAGQINYPKQPCFRASANVQANVTGNGAAYNIIFANVQFDQNTNFDGVSTFTAPVAGKYLFGCTLSITGGFVPGSLMDVYLQTSVGNFYLDTCNVYNCSSAGSFYKASYSMLMPLNALQAASITFVVFGGPKTVGVAGSATFWGYLVA